MIKAGLDKNPQYSVTRYYIVPIGLKSSLCTQIQYMSQRIGKQCYKGGGQ